MEVRPRPTLGWTVAAAFVTLVVVGAFVCLIVRSDGDSSPSESTFSRQFSVNGHLLYLACQGAGSPTVVLDAGLGDGHRAWDRVLNGAELDIRVCSYDRWGVGDSAEYSGDAARPLGDAVDDLHALLAVAGIQPPFVHVSHSIAGLIGRQYTQRYPDEVAGLVMVDTAPDDWDVYNDQPVFSSGGESLDIAEVAGALRASDRLGDRPVVVVKAARTSEISGAPEFAGYWQAAQRHLAELSSNAMYVVAADSNHGVPASQPALVRAAIGLVVHAAQRGERLPACAGSTLPPLGGTC